MKTRLVITQLPWFCLNHFNGFEVEVPEKLARDYMKTALKLQELHEKLLPIVEPYAESVDEKVLNQLRNHGLSSVPRDTKL